MWFLWRKAFPSETDVAKMIPPTVTNSLANMPVSQINVGTISGGINQVGNGNIQYLGPKPSIFRFDIKDSNAMEGGIYKTSFEIYVENSGDDCHLIATTPKDRIVSNHLTFMGEWRIWSRTVHIL
jgi:hypothetical protein